MNKKIHADLLNPTEDKTETRSDNVKNNWSDSLALISKYLDSVHTIHKGVAKQKKASDTCSIPRGSAIAKIVGFNCKRLDTFEDEVTMYVFEEMVDGKKLTEIINTTHENVKYLPGHKLPENVVAVPDVVEASKNADILIFVVPHQFIQNLAGAMLGKIKPTAVGLSLIKVIFFN